MSEKSQLEIFDELVETLNRPVDKKTSTSIDQAIKNINELYEEEESKQ